MSELPNMETPKLITDEDVAAMNREMTKKAIRNIVIFIGIKAAIYYSLHRWAKSVREANS